MLRRHYIMCTCSLCVTFFFAHYMNKYEKKPIIFLLWKKIKIKIFEEGEFGRRVELELRRHERWTTPKSMEGQKKRKRRTGRRVLGGVLNFAKKARRRSRIKGRRRRRSYRIPVYLFCCFFNVFFSFSRSLAVSFLNPHIKKDIHLCDPSIRALDNSRNNPSAKKLSVSVCDCKKKNKSDQKNEICRDGFVGLRGREYGPGAQLRGLPKTGQHILLTKNHLPQSQVLLRT